MLSTVHDIFLALRSLLLILFVLITLELLSTPSIMADKMDVDAVNGEREQETVGPAKELPPERSK